MKDVTCVKTKVFVAMSGGVDSSVAALLLQKKGFDVTGVYMKNWSEESFEGKFAAFCPWRKDLADVRAVCRKLGVPCKVYNFEKEYNRKVIDYFFKGEKRGTTPNPDIVCNREIKFGLFLSQALRDGADLIATGHYARLRREFLISNLQFPNKSKIQNPKQKYLSKIYVAKDKNKDQSYFLCLLNQRQLSKTLFPLGNLTKPRVREIAREAGLSTAEKPESMGICFVGEVKLNDFLKARIKEKPGKIVSKEGVVLGRHIGLPFYTIGQRQGLNLGGAVPFFVADKDVKKNRLIVAKGSANIALFRSNLVLKNINWISGKPPRLPLSCRVRIRHRQSLQRASIMKRSGKIIVRFATKQRAVTPGQFCAIYKNKILLGGGEIK